MDETLLHRLGVALAIGLIVGLERGWKTREEHAGVRLAGIRTFTLAALFGGVAAALAPADQVAVVLAAGFVAIGALVVIGYRLNVGATRDFGLTTELALLATFALGALAVARAPFEAGAGAIVMALLLGFKAEVHRAIAGLDRTEVLATLQLLLIAAVIVPLLPARDLGPWEAINPRTIGMLVLLIAGFSYLGYFAVRVLGSRLGVILTAFFGGLSSSTAVTVSYARRARAARAPTGLLGIGIALAAATMVPRLGIEIAIVNRAVLAELWPTFFVLAVVPLAQLLRIAFLARTDDAATGIRLSNPLQLRAALTFGVLLSGLFIAAAALQEHVGEAGVYATAAVAGLVDVDAIGVALAESATRGLDPVTAARAIVVATLVNTASKAVIAAALGGPRMLRTASVTLFAALLAAGVTAVLTLRP